jgi:hypothetical protein
MIVRQMSPPLSRSVVLVGPPVFVSPPSGLLLITSDMCLHTSLPAGGKDPAP